MKASEFGDKLFKAPPIRVVLDGDELMFKLKGFIELPPPLAVPMLTMLNWLAPFRFWLLNLFTSPPPDKLLLVGFEMLKLLKFLFKPELLKLFVLLLATIEAPNPM